MDLPNKAEVKTSTFKAKARGVIKAREAKAWHNSSDTHSKITVLYLEFMKIKISFSQKPHLKARNKQHLTDNSDASGLSDVSMSREDVFANAETRPRTLQSQRSLGQRPIHRFGP